MSDLLDDKMPIKYVLIGESTSIKIITEFTSGTPDTKTKKEINKIFNKVAKMPNKKFDERNKLAAKDENYYFTHIKPDLVFIILVNSSYPERYVFELISKIVEENIPTMVNDETRELNPEGRQALKDLVNKYQDIKNINKIAEIQEDVNALKVDMKKNINAMVKSVEDVEDLQNKSEQLKLEAQDYKQNSIELRKLAWWQNFKLWIIIGVIAAIIALVFGLVFGLRGRNSS
jgi:Txe/YoeB family toxin of Txe-Axe toxin-antitoxin module